MPGCVQTMVDTSFGYVHPYVQNARSRSKALDKSFDACERFTKPVIENVDNAIDNEIYPKCKEIYSKCKDTISSVPTVLNETKMSDVQNYINTKYPVVEEKLHTVLDKVVPREEDGGDTATLYQRVTKAPWAVVHLVILYATIVWNYTKMWLEFGKDKAIIFAKWAMVQAQPILEIEAVRFYVEQARSTASHFVVEYRELALSKFDLAKKTATTYYDTAFTKIPELKAYAVARGVPVDKIELYVTDGKKYIAMGVDKLPPSVIDFLESLPVVGPYWAKVFCFIQTDCTTKKESKERKIDHSSKSETTESVNSQVPHSHED